MFTVILFAIALVGGFVTIVARKQKGAARFQTLAGWLLVCHMGLGGVWAFVGHTVFHTQVAESIGWPPSPFQWEVAVANLAVGTLGLLSAVYRGQFRLAAAIAGNVFLLGCAAGHFHQAFVHGNFAAGNFGAILWIHDILSPLLILTLVLLGEMRNRSLTTT